MRNLLITGGAGFIGSNFVHYWLKEHPEDHVVVLDALTYAGSLASLQLAKSQTLRFIHGNICDGRLVETILREETIDTIVHFAAESHVDRSIHGPDVFVETNVIGTHTLLKAAREFWINADSVSDHRFHHVSTDEVFGSLECDDRAFTEASRYAPNSPYSATKASSDHLVRAYHHTYGLKVTSSNCSNNYGPYQFPEKLVPLIMLNILHGRYLPIYGDGLNIRDWLNVHDHCRGIDMILSKGRVGECYNIGGKSECANLALVSRICEIADDILRCYDGLVARYPLCPAAKGSCASSLIRFVKDRAGHDRRYAIDSEKIEQELGYRATISLDQGLRDAFQWYVQNEWWWRGVVGVAEANAVPQL